VRSGWEGGGLGKGGEGDSRERTRKRDQKEERKKRVHGERTKFREEEESKHEESKEHAKKQNRVYIAFTRIDINTAHIAHTRTCPSVCVRRSVSKPNDSIAGKYACTENNGVPGFGSSAVT
jgi:hypothetical protein